MADPNSGNTLGNKWDEGPSQPAGQSSNYQTGIPDNESPLRRKEHLIVNAHEDEGHIAALNQRTTSTEEIKPILPSHPTSALEASPRHGFLPMDEEEYQISFKRPLVAALFDACKRAIEYVTAHQLSWSPLAQPEDELKPGYVRVYSMNLVSRIFFGRIVVPIISVAKRKILRRRSNLACGRLVP